MTSASVRCREPGWHRLRQLGLAVRATTLVEGLRAARRGRPLVTVGDVGAWALARVEAEPDPPDAVLELLGIPDGTGNDPDSLADAERTLGPLVAAEQAAHVDPRAELAKWRVVDLAALIDLIATWPLDPAEDFDGRPCSMWSACRELWSHWAELLDRPPFFYPGGRECRCYDGRMFEDVIAEYRAWLAAEVARLRALDGAAG